jgi:hypothetical protein
MEFHYVLTVTMPQHNGFKNITVTGTVTLIPSDTRRDVFNALIEELTQELGSEDRLNVLFFSLEPNDLLAAVTA